MNNQIASSWRIKLVPPLLLMSLVLKIASMDIYIPCMPHLTCCFNTKEWVIQLSLMVSPLLSSITALFYGRWTDTHGRRKIMLISLMIFVVGSLICALSSEIYLFLVGRVVQAAGSGGMSILTLVILSDMFHGIKYARYIALYHTMFPITFAIAPVLGAQLFERYNWQLNFWVLMVGALFVLISLYWILPESLSLEKKQEDSWSSIWGKSLLLIKNSYFMTMTFGHCLPIAIACIFSANSAFLFIDRFQCTPITFSYIQLIPVGANFLGAVLYRQYLPRLGLEKSLQVGITTLGLFVSCALFCLVFSDGGLPVFILSTICVLNFGLPFSNSTCATWAYESTTADRGLAIAWVALVRNALISSCVMLTAIFYNGSIAPIFIIMASLSTIAVVILQSGLSLAKRLAVKS
ncbi:MFS transporter [Candidatus Finniella inopinata]|uniref:MFS transporter n=1 Tax=Candidatus Finniella inopinata TaxID=1696036 RepID=A0A4Q7DJW2_9PROT|nr:MFS transporter [Candidatus Finniella inopinata]RZI47042.1 MFS transporter [Candidatus Finniella inopinata]